MNEVRSAHPTQEWKQNMRVCGKCSPSARKCSKIPPLSKMISKIINMLCLTYWIELLVKTKKKTQCLVTCQSVAFRHFTLNLLYPMLYGTKINKKNTLKNECQKPWIADFSPILYNLLLFVFGYFSVVCASIRFFLLFHFILWDFLFVFFMFYAEKMAWITGNHLAEEKKPDHHLSYNDFVLFSLMN